MTSPTETTNLEVELLDLQKQLGEEKRAHGETIHRYLSIKAQAQTAESEAAKAQELVAETTLKLDQAREEIKRLRSQAQEAQFNIEDLKAQMAQMKILEQSQIALEAQAQELEIARAKIASLEARMIKVRAAVAESEVDINPAEAQAEELQAKIENLEVRMAQMKVVEQFQTQTQELKAAQEKIKDLEAQLAQSEKKTQEKIILLNSEIKDQKAQTQELEAAQAQAQEEVRSLRAQTEAQTQELKAAQAKIKDLEAKIQSKPKAPVQVPFKPSFQPRDLSWLENSYCLDSDHVNFISAPWFGPNHLHYFVGQILRLGYSGLKGEDMVQFLDSWLAGSYPDLEMIILNDFQSKSTAFDKFASSLVRQYSDDDLSRTSTFHFERPSDGRIACVKITRDVFIFVL